MPRVLLIDDDLEFLEMAQGALQPGYEVACARCPDEAFPILERESFSLIITDLHMPFALGARAGEFMTSFEVGIRTAKELRWVFPGLPVVALSAASFSDLQRIEKLLYPIRAFPKPKRVADIRTLIKELLEPDGAVQVAQ